MSDVTRHTETGARRLKPYPKYKDSGVEWLGKIPEHWEVIRSKRVFSLRDVKVRADEQQLTASQEYGVIPQAEFMAKEGRRVMQVVTGSDILKHVEPNDFVISMRSFQGGIEWSRYSGSISSAYVVLAPSKRVEHAYFVYLLKSRRYIEALQSTSNLVRDGQALRFENFSLVDLPSLPRFEQQAIAAFLARETAKIDALVGQKKRLVELLQEKRNATVTRAVTKGLDPSVPMKDSGVEWLGEIPAHWEISAIKRILRRCDYGVSESLAGGGDIRVLTMAHIQNGEVVLPEVGSLERVDSTLFVDKYDLLFNRTNSRDLVGKVGIFRGSRSDNVTFASYLVRMATRRGIAPPWLNYLLNSVGLLALVRSLALLSVNQANLNPTRYTQIKIPVPPIQEQAAIADFLAAETTAVDALIRRIRDCIDHLKERRTALISAAVTGKIDVRGEVS